MLLAVLEARCGLTFGDHDVYLNVAGGLRIAEPAADLAAAAALVASSCNVTLPAKRLYFGEISLSGAVRACPYMALRLKEAKNSASIGRSSPLRERSAATAAGPRSHASAISRSLRTGFGHATERVEEVSRPNEPPANGGASTMIGPLTYLDAALIAVAFIRHARHVPGAHCAS